MTNYPLIESLNVKVARYFKNIDVVDACHLEAALAKLPPVRVEAGGIVLEATYIDAIKDTAFIRVEPIKPPDTAESLLREFIKSDDCMRIQNEPWINRARLLLEGK